MVAHVPKDVTTHLMNHLLLHPTLRTCSSDTILRANSVMRGCVHARRTLKGLVADLRINYLKGLFETVYLADIIEQRHKIKRDSEFRNLVLILASSIGVPCNPTKISNTFKSVKNVSIGSQTIANISFGSAINRQLPIELLEEKEK